MGSWTLGKMGWRQASGCPRFLGADEVAGSAALTDDGVIYVEDSAGFITEWDFPGFTSSATYDLGDMTFPGGTFDAALIVTGLSGGMATTGVDDYFYAWISNDVEEGQQVIARFDRTDMLNPTVLYNPGETPGVFSFFRRTMLTWHPETPDVLWAVQVDVDPNFPDAFTVGRADLFSVDISTGTRTDALDLTTITTIGGIWRSLAEAPHQLQQWDRGVIFPLATEIDDSSGVLLAYDVITDAFNTYGIPEARSVGYGVVPGAGAYGYGQAIGRWTEPITDDRHPLDPIDIDAGGTMTLGTSTCQFVGDVGSTDLGYPSTWFAPPARGHIYVSEWGRFWRLGP